MRSANTNHEPVQTELDQHVTELLKDTISAAAPQVITGAPAMFSVSGAVGCGGVASLEPERAIDVSFAQHQATKHSLAVLTLGSAYRRDISPLLTEHLPEEWIVHFGLLDGLTHDEIVERFTPQANENVVLMHHDDGAHLMLSAAKIGEALQKKILALEGEGYETILILCAGEYKNLFSTSAILLEPYRILPPLVEAIIDGYQVGIVVARDEYIAEQAYKWQRLTHKPHFAVASPWQASDDELIDAALQLQEQGADVVVLDCLGYHQRHRDFLQKLLGIPVLLSNVLIAKLAAELLV